MSLTLLFQLLLTLSIVHSVKNFQFRLNKLFLNGEYMSDKQKSKEAKRIFYFFSVGNRKFMMGATKVQRPS